MFVDTIADRPLKSGDVLHVLKHPVVVSEKGLSPGLSLGRGHFGFELRTPAGDHVVIANDAGPRGGILGPVHTQTYRNIRLDDHERLRTPGSHVKLHGRAGVRESDGPVFLIMDAVPGAPLLGGPGGSLHEAVPKGPESLENFISRFHGMSPYGLPPEAGLSASGGVSRPRPDNPRTRHERGPASRRCE